MRFRSSVPHFFEVFSLLRMSGTYPSNVGTFFETDVRESFLFMTVRTAVIRSGLKDSRSALLSAVGHLESYLGCGAVAAGFF
jgi:hypothetical protein